MKLNSVRRSFSVLFIGATDPLWLRWEPALKEAGYQVRQVSSVDDAMAEVRINPPHIVVVDLASQPGYPLLHNLRTTVPETVVLLLAEAGQWSETQELLGTGIAEILHRQNLTEPILIQRLDRVAASIYRQLENEQLLAERRRVQARSPVNEPSVPFFSDWAQELFQKRSVDAAIQHFMKEVSRFYDGAPVLFLRPLWAKSSLLITHAVAREEPAASRVRGMGFNLLENSDLPIFEQMRQTQKIPGLANFLRELGFGPRWHLFDYRIKDEWYGLFALFLEKPGYSDQEWLLPQSYVGGCFSLLSTCHDYLNLQIHKHRADRHDEETGFLDLASFHEQIRLEISRARRVQLPVSLVVMSIDSQPALDPHLRKVAFKWLGRFLRQNGRGYDFFGRLDETSIGFLMPHAVHQDAVVKAERLRRAIASADFSRMVEDPPQLIVAAGVSEYPYFAGDADDLFRTADEARLAAQRAGGQGAVLARRGPAFQPEFWPLGRA